MKALKIFGAVAVLAVSALVVMAFVNSKKAGDLNNEKGFALVELFTSEGCSSCPPADELVAKIQKESNDKPIYVLAYHVDYWDRLGWKDVFSNADFSKRQREYAKYLKVQSVYTPQIVVNGKTEFVGSEEGTLRKAIKSGLGKKASDQLTLTITAISGDYAKLKYTIGGNEKDNDLFLAIVQKSAQTKVEAGENGGHTLSHVQIVRVLQKISLNGKAGVADIKLPQDYNQQGWEMIGFLQNNTDGSISGASKAEPTLQANTGGSM